MKQLTRTHLRLLCALVVLLAGCGEADDPVRPLRPNVVLVSIDTLRADHLSAYGYHRQTTPFLDSFARNAALFKYAYAHVPFTLKSHMSIFTSLFPAAHGVTKETMLSGTMSTLPQELKDSGYRTVGLYTQVWLDSKFGFSRGFDRYEFMKSGKAVRDAAIALMSDLVADATNPFFLFLHLREVHCGPGLKDPKKPLYNSPPQFRDYFLPFPDISVDYKPEDIWENKVQLNEKELANVVAQYDGGILYADSLVRDIFSELEKHGLYEDSFILVTSDHGESLGARNDFKSHGGYWEEGLRVPLIAKLPDSHPERGKWRGVKVDYRVQSVDIAPTILGVLGLPIPEAFQGQNLFDSRNRDVIADQGAVSVLIRGNYKLRIFKQKGRMEARLYDLLNDPGETTSIHLEQPKLTNSMITALRSHLHQHRKFFDTYADSTAEEVELDEAKQEQLRALGYLN